MNVLETEDLRGGVLVGHSFGGIPITGAADRVPERIWHLVYLDAAIMESDQSFIDTFAPQVAARRRAAQEQGGGVAVPPGGGYRDLAFQDKSGG